MPIFANHDRGIPGDDCVWRHAFRDDRSRRDDGVFADRHAFENDRVHPDPDVIRDADGRGADRRARRALFVKGRERERVEAPLRGIDRMKIGVGDPDVPGDEAVAADLDQLLGHDERAVHQSEIADRAAAVDAERKGTTGVTGNVVAQPHGVLLAVAEEAKDLRRLAIEAGAEVNVRRNRISPPIAFDAALAVDVAHWEG